MKKILIFLFAFCFLLTGCNKKQDEQEKEPIPPSPITTPTYTNEEIRLKLKSTVFEYQQRIAEKQQIQLEGEFNAPDSGFNGMNVYKNIDVKIDTKASDPFIKLKADVFVKEDNKIKDNPDKRIEIIKNTESVSLLRRDSVDYVLEDYQDEKHKSYSKTVNENGGIILDAVIQAVAEAFKEFKVDDLPNTIEYSYDRENVTYGMKMKFKDLDGTPLSEYMNILLGFLPELNELFLQFKDDIVISLDNIKLDTPISTFDIDIIFPAMQGAFEFNIIHGSFKVKYKNFIREDVKKLPLCNTYLKAKLGINNVGKYLEVIKVNDVNKYKATLVIDTLSTLDISILDVQNIDIIELIKNKKILLEAIGAESINFYNRFDHTPIEVIDNTLDLGILDMVLVEIIYPNNINHVVTVTNVTNNEEEGTTPPTENL